MKFNFNNKVIFITGSSSGIGLGLARSLKKNGAIVVINGRNIGKLKDSQKIIKADYAIPCDMVDPSESAIAVEKIISKFGRLDGLICNVGSGRSVEPGMETHEEWLRVIGINFISAVNTISSSKEYLIRSKGSIVCISSICGLEVIEGAPLTYSCSKAALNSYVKGISRVFAKDEVRINALALGNILFEESSWEKKLTEDADKTMEYLKKNVPLNKFGKISDINNVAQYLLSPLSNFITGAIWNIDGGQVRSY